MDNQDKRKLIEQTELSDVLQLIFEENIFEGTPTYEIVGVIQQMNNDIQKGLLYNQEFLKKFELQKYQLTSIIKKIDEKTRVEILTDTEFVKNELKFENYEIVDITKTLSNDMDKDKIINMYQISGYNKLEIFKTCSDGYKMDQLLNNEDLRRNEDIDILREMDLKEVYKFINKNKNFFKEKDIHIHEITCHLDSEKQKDFINNLEDLEISVGEKKTIFATLKPEVKQSIDRTELPKEYKTALEIKTTEYGRIDELEFDRDTEDYRGLDSLICINPEKYTEEQRKALLKLCDVCPDMKVLNSLDEKVTFSSNGVDYKEAEEWISSVMQEIKPEYSKLQKMAVIDNAIGKRVSYTPDFGTEVFDWKKSRALWKIISSGYGVCNGISRVEQYMLERVDIESELISSGSHAFLKIKDVEIPNEEGQMVRGDTIIDPTWNLTVHRIGGRPNNFCINYEQARKEDINANGRDQECHKNDEKLQDVKLFLDDKNLREMFTSVGLADREGRFPVKSLIEKSNQIDAQFASQPSENIKNQFLLLKSMCPEFATCQNSSMCVIRDILLHHENIRFNKCVASRVYNKSDEDKEPILYVYIDSNDIGRKFYVASKENGQFVEQSQEEFEKNYECYQTDLTNAKGLRPWENNKKTKQEEDLSKSSGKMVAEEGEER